MIVPGASLVGYSTVRRCRSARTWFPLSVGAWPRPSQANGLADACVAKALAATTTAATVAKRHNLFMVSSPYPCLISRPRGAKVQIDRKNLRWGPGIGYRGAEGERMTRPSKGARLRWLDA